LNSGKIQPREKQAKKILSATQLQSPGSALSEGDGVSTAATDTPPLLLLSLRSGPLHCWLPRRTSATRVAKAPLAQDTAPACTFLSDVRIHQVGF